MDIGGFSAIGPRDSNEDSLFYRDFSDVDTLADGIHAFVMVSDGMGGYQGGDVASGLAVACAERYLDQLLEMARGNRVQLDVGLALTEMVRNAHESICAESAKRGNASMGATFVGAFVSDDHAWIGHVGDSRAYLVHEGTCRQLTEDHSHVGRLLSRGIITEREAQNHPDRNRIERALGFSDAAPDIDEVDLAVGDALLLCSDGVYTTMDASALGDCVSGARDAGKAAERAVTRALRHGSDDNSTAVVLRCAPAAQKTGANATQRIGPPQQDDSAPGTVVSRPLDAWEGGSAEETAPGRRGSWARYLPVALVAFAVGVGAVFALRTCLPGVVPTQEPADERQGGARSQEESEQSSEPQDDAAQQQGEAASGEGPAQADGESSYVRQTIPSGSSPELKYVDANGVAQVFTDEPLGVSSPLVLRSGASVSLRSKSDSFGRYKTYQALSDGYLRDLRTDLEDRRQGATTFESALSGLFEAEAYQAFLDELVAAGSDPLSDVSQLVVETLTHDGVEQDGQGTSVSAPDSETDASAATSDDAASAPADGNGEAVAYVDDYSNDVGL